MVNVLILIASAMLAPIYAVYVQDIGGSLLDAGVAMSMFALAAGTMSLISGRLAGRVKRKYLLVGIGYILSGLGFIVHALVGSMWQLFAVQVFIGLVQASYAPVFDGLHGMFTGNVKQAGSRQSLWEASNYFSIAIGSIAGATIVVYANFQTMFFVMAAICIISGFYLLAAGKKFRL